MVQVFISCRFSEALEQAEMLKSALIGQEISCFLCSVHAGDSIGKAVMENLLAAELVVILGTKTYGKETESNFSTYHELMYILDEKKPYFLIKMCEQFEETAAKFRFTSTIASFPWPVKDHYKLPPDLVPQIKQKLMKVSDLAMIMERTKVSPPKDDQLARLSRGGQRSDFAATVEILRTAANAKDAELGCTAIWNLAALNLDNKKELGRVGACDAVVKALERFGTENLEIAIIGCMAVATLGRDGDNRKELGRVGACDAVVNALKRFGEENVQVAEQGCGAVRNLAHDDDNKKELGRIGACDAVAKALKRFGVENADVAQQGCEAVWNLATNNDVNKKELGRLGACDAVVKAFKRFGAENADVARNGCGAIWNLAHNNKVNKKELGRVGAKGVVLACKDNLFKTDALRVL